MAGFTPSGRRAWRLRWLLFLGAVAAPLLPAAAQQHPPGAGPAAAGSTGTSTLSPADARQRIAALRAEIAHHDALYFQEAAPEISDFAYDELTRELAELARAFPELAASAPRAATADDRTGRFPTHRHRARMLSLDKTYSEAELREFHRRIARELGRDDLDYVVEPKIDGVAISITFEHGALVRAVTRGDGDEGDDVTANVLTIDTLPRALRPFAPDGSANPVPESIELRGEIFVPLAAFERINREREAAGEEPFANPRNLAAGTIKRLDPQEVAARGLAIVFHGWGACEPAALAPPTQHGFQEQLAAWGLPALEPRWRARGIDEAWAAVQACREARPALGCAIDGAVVKLDDAAQQRALGAGEEAPRWAIACKFAPERAETQLRAITWQVGRTGVLTPVAELAPVELAGSTVARASLHNRATIARLDLRIGDFVFLEKAGEIIPAVAGVNLARRPADARPYEFPTACPGCAAELVQQAGEAAVRCPNAACPAQLRRRLEHFASVEAVNIDGLGPATIDALVSRGAVDDVADFFRLGRGDLPAPSADGATADSLLAAIERSKHAGLWRFVHGLGIRGVGAVTARKLARQFSGLDTFVAADFSSADLRERLRAAGIGDATLRNIAAHFADDRNRAVVAELLALGVRPASSATGADAPLAGRIFVLTGRLPHLTREQARERIEAAGGEVRDYVSRAVDYVVAGSEPGEKLARARALGVAILDEAALLRLLAGAEPSGSP